MQIGGTNGNWSAQVALLPFMERFDVYRHVDFSQGCTQVYLPDGTRLSAFRVPTYLCPSETNDTVRLNNSGEPYHYPLSYGFNAGVWLVWEPAAQRGGQGAFFPYSWLRPADFTDGLSNTLAFSEVKAYEPYFRNAAHAGPLPLPNDPSEICSFGGTFYRNTGHTEWSEGRCHQTGFTATFAPNTKVLCNYGGQQYDVNWNNQQEGLSATVPTYAAVVSRSYHPGVVNALMMDGSCRAFPSTVERGAWQALATRNGGEVVAQGP